MSIIVMMVLKTLFFLIILFQIAFASQDSIVIKLKNDIIIKASLVEDFGRFRTYCPLKVVIKGQVAYIDTTSEYELNERGYPKVEMLAGKKIEMLIEINDRPAINKLRKLLIKDNKVIENELIPVFTEIWKNYDEDRFFENRGYLSASEAVCMNCA